MLDLNIAVKYVCKQQESNSVKNYFLRVKIFDSEVTLPTHMMI